MIAGKWTKCAFKGVHQGVHTLVLDQLLHVPASIITKLALMRFFFENVGSLQLGPVTPSSGGPWKLAMVQYLVLVEF